MIRFAATLAVLALTGAGHAAAPADTAKDYPTKPVHIVVPSPPGGTIDPITRVLAEALARTYGQNFVIDNRPGANFNVGMALVAKAEPDGYTLVMASAGALAINIHMYKELPFHPVKDFEPVALYGDVPNILVVNLGLPVQTLKEFTDYARANPGKINFGSSGNGSSMHTVQTMHNFLMTSWPPSISPATSPARSQTPMRPTGLERPRP